MYDELGGDVPVPDDAMREGVRLRAASLRRRRRVVMGGSALASCLVIVVAAAALTSGPHTGAVDVVDIPTPTETATVEPPTPSPAPTGAPTPTPTPTPTVEATSAPSASPSCVEPEPGYTSWCPDGHSGWDSSRFGCDPAPAVVGGRTARLADGVTVTYVLPGHIAQGQTASGVLRFATTRSDTVVVTVDFHEPSEAWVRGAGGAAALHWTDMMGGPEISLSPQDPVHEEPLPAGTRACGDTADDPEPALAKGSYEAGGTFRFRAVTRAQHSTEPTPQPTALPPVGASPSPSASPATEAPVSEQGTFSVRVPLEID